MKSSVYQFGLNQISPLFRSDAQKPDTALYRAFLLYFSVRV